MKAITKGIIFFILYLVSWAMFRTAYPDSWEAPRWALIATLITIGIAGIFPLTLAFRLKSPMVLTMSSRHSSLSPLPKWHYPADPDKNFPALGVWIIDGYLDKDSRMSYAGKSVLIAPVDASCVLRNGKREIFATVVYTQPQPLNPRTAHQVIQGILGSMARNLFNHSKSTYRKGESKVSISLLNFLKGEITGRTDIEESMIFDKSILTSGNVDISRDPERALLEELVVTEKIKEPKTLLQKLRAALTVTEEERLREEDLSG